MKILPNKINKFFDTILSKLSVPKKDRNLLIKSLLDSSIRGVDSHGIRLFSHYVKCIENGRIKAKPKIPGISVPPESSVVRPLPKSADKSPIHAPAPSSAKE